jgi:hypothetical protein
LDDHNAAKNRSGYRHHRVVIIVSAGDLYVLVNLPPNPSMAEKMILQSVDISPSGMRSSSVSQFSMNHANESSIYRAVLGNESIHLYLRIDVFNSSNDSRAAFLGTLQSSLANGTTSP